ncbi:putative transcription factor MYB-HB-like family [Helianthus annuus]|uniref:Putative homeodomain-like, Myb-like domain protein n=1 Tax=Helianthus annuus TaxID=4232 RepID=A0A251TNZ9_HELAN|nr:RNA polymerase I termination factor [Helianthus annuus]KAF5787716.1 putative transcription factor MYB-HB-like family [Helianthus annuus]
MSQIEEKSKKGKQNETNNLQDIDNGDSCLNTAGGFSKDNKLKSVLNEDEVEKSEGNDGNLAQPVKKKRKHEVTENESKLKVKSEKVSFSSRVETDGDSCVNAAGDFPKDNELKSLLNEDKNEDEVEKSKGNDGKLAKKTKKKRKREVTENESKSKVKSGKVSFSSRVETDGDSCLNAAGDFSKDNKLKSVLNEDKDEDEVEKGKGNDDNLAKVKKKRKVTENESNSKVKVKKVSFSSHVETFPASDTQNEKSKTEEDNLVRGKRFTPEEDEIVKDAVLHYIKSHALGEEGLNMVLNCHAYPQIRNCWREIGMCIPYRPHTAIYYRAHTLFERGEKRKWTKEETEFLQECYEKHGNDWKMVAKELGKNRVHVKDKWRRIKLSNKRRGKWSQEEYQNLYDLVNLDLQMKVVSQEKRSKHGMLRDDIPWGAISDKLSTRTDSTCCLKWYSQLTSSLVAENKWSNADDYRLIKALYDLDAACVEDVDWDSILEHRPGDVCRKRWDQMVLHIGYHGSKPFSEQVEILSERYCPDLTEIREAWDGKPSRQ